MQRIKRVFNIGIEKCEAAVVMSRSFHASKTPKRSRKFYNI